MTHDSCGQRRLRPTDRAIAELADAQHGVVARRQLAAFGLTDKEIDYRSEIGRLHIVHRGVYSVGIASSRSTAGGWRRCWSLAPMRC